MSNFVAGIDFGTTTSCISYYNKESKQVQVIPNEQGNFTSPSILFLDSESSEMLFSDSALQLLYSNNNQHYLSNIFNNLKRLVSKTCIDATLLPFFKHNTINSTTNQITFDIIYNNKQESLNVSTLITFYLKYLKLLLCNHFSIESNTTLEIVLTVPAYFDDHQRTILKDCCESIGLLVLRIINEPTAASLAYALDKHKQLDTTHSINEEFILTFDCGGGTTDISLLHLDYIDSIYEVKNTVGDNLLGGEDITNNLVNFIAQKLKLENLNNKTLNKIKKQAEDAKKQLSFSQQTTIYLEIGDNDYTLTISQSQFNDINKEFYKKIRNLIYYILDDYIQKTSEKTFDYSKINSVIFVGGTSRIPYFKSLFQEIFPQAQINNTIDPDQTISIGASIQGALLKDLIDQESGGDTLLMDIVPLSIGIETIGGIMSPIVSRNSLLPISRSQSFTNSDGYEDTITINIYQGERKLVKDNIFLASFDLKSELFTNYDKGEIQIYITFEIDSNSIIHAKATAKVNDNEVQSNIQVTKNHKNEPSVAKNLDEILLSAEMNKLVDTELSNKILAKIELYDSFKYLLSVFHEKKNIEQINDEFMLTQLNELFNHTFNIIQNYTEYSSNELEDIKKLFEKKWHTLLFSSNITLKNDDGQIIEFGGTIID
jgi:molecular chaperone DnaK (HSP70)